MSSKKKKKYFQKQQNIVIQKQETPLPKLRSQVSPVRFAAMITAVFFIIALIGILNHEMWRDEHQAWLVARDANSLPRLLDNMKYEGNPALWQFLLYWITCFTHDAVYMQVLHLLIAGASIFIFNRYAPLANRYKILFSFGYFPLYEYAVISRSYIVSILLLFAICSLYKNRASKYIIIGLLLALLSNVNIYAVVFACLIAVVLVLDYFIYQNKNRKAIVQLATGIIIFALGTVFSLYQIMPETDNSFPASYSSGFLDMPRWWQVGSKFFTTYTYIPEIETNFWNTNIYFKDPESIVASSFGSWLSQNPGYLMVGFILPIMFFATGIFIFLRRPLVLLLYAGITLGLLAVFYYTALMYERYCGYLLIALVACYWLADYYPEKKRMGSIEGSLSRLGTSLNKPFFTLILILNVIGAIVAYSMELQNKFSTAQEASTYIRENKLDTLPVAGTTDFIISPLASYLDKKIFYPQMNDMGSFTIWSQKRKIQQHFYEVMNSVDSFMGNRNSKMLLIQDGAPRVSLDGKTTIDLEKAIIRNNLQLDLLKKVDPGVVSEEKYYIYMVQKINPSTADYSNYIRINY